jgi:hypothetical protein
MCIYSRLIRHSDSSIFYEGHTLIVRRQRIHKSPESGDTFPIYAFGRKYSQRLNYALQVTEFLSQNSDSTCVAPLAALAGTVPTRCGHTLVQAEADFASHCTIT